MPGTWNFRIIDRNTKAIFREYFSSLHEDSGMIFKLMSLISFTCGPRTTYCICHENIFHCFHPSICVFNSSEVQNMSSKQIFRFWLPKNCIFPCRNVWETGNKFNLVQQVRIRADDVHVFSWFSHLSLSIRVISLGFPCLFFGPKMSVDSQLSDLTDSK